MNADVALITSKNVVYMVKYTQKLNETSFDFSFYRYWQYKDIASLRQYGLGNNTVVNIGKFIKSSKYSNSIVLIKGSSVHSDVVQEVNEIISSCMMLGIMVTLNQRLDAETLTIVASEFEYDVEFVSAEVQEAIEEFKDDPSN